MLCQCQQHQQSLDGSSNCSQGLSHSSVNINVSIILLDDHERGQFLLIPIDTDLVTKYFKLPFIGKYLSFAQRKVRC